MSNLSRRSFTALSIAFLAELAFPHFAFAHGKRGHNTELESVLFGNPNYKSQHRSGPAGKGVRAIEAASYLCIDQFQGHGSKEHEWLNNNGFGSILESLDEINYTSSGKNHREYTHCGWDIDYKDDVAHWQRRKKILLDTVETVFDFKVLPSWLVGYDERCDSFAALVYYVHILGDFLEDDTMGKFTGQSNGKKVKFARVYPTDSSPDLFWDLEKHIEILFLDQSGSWTYQALLMDLKNLARRARKIARQRGDIEESRFEEVHACAEELMVLLSGHNDPDYASEYKYRGRIHSMLSEESFFGEVFPSN